MTLENGLTSAKYTAPIGEHIFPEITRFGVPGYPSPVPFENFCFLNTSDAVYKQELADGTAQPVRACDNQ
jgi:hypothetical protein